MHKKSYVLVLAAVLLVFTGCGRDPNNEPVSFNNSEPNSTKISSWRGKLEKAENDLELAKTTVRKYQEKIFREELREIKNHVSNCEAIMEKITSDPQKFSDLLKEELSDLFLKEREELHVIMQSENAKLAGEAEEILNHILRLITQLGTKRD